ncbi:unnamed protein product, partial [Sphacelaria rigidula]
MQALGFSVPQEQGVSQVSKSGNPVASEVEHSSDNTMLQNNTSKPQDSVNDPVDSFEVELPNTTPIQSTESSGTLTLDPPTSLTSVQENSHNIEPLSSSVLTP